MSPHQFGETLVPWHDFFLAAAGASAALLGLLFVGVSINLTAISADERVDLRTRAAQAFANLVFVLVVSLLLLIPDMDPTSLAAALALISAFGLIRVARNVRSLVRVKQPLGRLLPTFRRIGWTAVADVILAFTAWRIWDSGGAAAVISNLTPVVFILLVGAADIAWNMLTEVSR